MGLGMLVYRHFLPYYRPSGTSIVAWLSLISSDIEEKAA